MPIYEVEVSATLVVEADDELHARRAAQRCVGEAVMDGCGYTDVNGEIATAAELPAGWSDEDYPYGGKGHARICDLLPTNARNQACEPEG